MTSVDPSCTALPATDPHALHRASTAGLVASMMLGEPGVIGAAVLRHDSPVVAVRAATLPQARDLAARFDLTWHTQATGAALGDGVLWVHAFEGRLAEVFPVTVYALGERDHDPDVAALAGPCAVPLLLAGLIL